MHSDPVELPSAESAGAPLADGAMPVELPALRAIVAEGQPATRVGLRAVLTSAGVAVGFAAYLLLRGRQLPTHVERTTQAEG